MSYIHLLLQKLEEMRDVFVSEVLKGAKKTDFFFISSAIFSFADTCILNQISMHIKTLE
jgi:hypothetical protein